MAKAHAAHLEEPEADRVVQFINRLRHTKGVWAGKPFNLEPWQTQIVRDVFGTRRDNRTRQYRTVYLEVPRKNGKSELAAAIAVYMLLGDGEQAAEVYSAASDRQQAGIVFEQAKLMILQDPQLRSMCKIIDSVKRIVVKETNSIYAVLSSDHASAHGFNASAVLFDELHTQPNRQLYDVLTTSGGTRRQPLTVAITTAGFDRTSICWEVHEHADQVARGIVKDAAYYPVIYAAEESDDWTDDKVWHKANPALGSFRDIEEMREFCNRAKQVPGLQNTFRRLYLNQWTRQETRWLDMMTWDDTAGEVYWEDLQGETCYAGLDLASSIDIAACVLLFPDPEGCFDVWPLFWVPEDTLVERTLREGIPYAEWQEQGYLKTTPGNTIDYGVIRADLMALNDEVRIESIAFDQWGATQLVQELGDAGFDVVKYSMVITTLSSPTKELLRLVTEGRLRHGSNPVLRWMADNLVVRQDVNQNVRPDKSKSKEKIDGIVALILAIDQATRHEQPSVYETEDIKVI